MSMLFSTKILLISHCAFSKSFDTTPVAEIKTYEDDKNCFRFISVILRIKRVFERLCGQSCINYTCLVAKPFETEF